MSSIRTFCLIISKNILLKQTLNKIMIGLWLDYELIYHEIFRTIKKRPFELKLKKIYTCNNEGFLFGMNFLEFLYDFV